MSGLPPPRSFRRYLSRQPHLPNVTPTG
jgi:hypothetical protein